MRIATRLHLNTAIIAIAALAIGIVLILFDLQRGRLRDRLEVLNRKIEPSIFQLHSLAQELRYASNARVTSQIDGFIAILLRDVKQLQTETVEEETLRAALADDVAIIEALFARVRAFEVVNPDGMGLELLREQLLLKTQELIFTDMELVDVVSTRLASAGRTAVYLIAGTMMGLVVAVGWAGTRLSASIMEPLQRLMTGTRALGAGRLDYRIQLQRADELGEVAAAFDGMAKEICEAHAELESRVRQRTASLEAAIKDIEAFSYSVSHDLRAPLRAIGGFSGILLEEYRDKLDAEGQRLLNVVRDNTLKLSRMIDDILVFSRTSRVEMKGVRVDMEAMVNAVLADALSEARAGRNIAIQVGRLPPVQGDQAMLERVWTNLLDNAIKFTGPKPDAKIEVGATTDVGEITYYVRDNGIGFDMQHVGKLFGLFQRLHGAEVPGTGIGLAIVARIVARHGGRVWAEGKVGEGATFHFTIPMEEMKQL
jgi:signal transduction histidine kinase